jgi:hypothetical protein
MFVIERSGRLEIEEASMFMQRAAFWLGDSHAGR